VPFHRVSDPERLHALIESMLLIESELDLPVLLRSIVSVASELAGARYGALGISTSDGSELNQFITYGLTAEEQRRIGDLPTGHGLLGGVLHDAKSRRSPNIDHEPDSVGFPANHPKMTTFLGVPVLAGDGRVFGTLYLCDRIDGEPFSEEDEALVEGFGRAASLIVDKALLRAQLREFTLTEERERMARDLHDTVIQRLFAVGLSLQSVVSSNLEPASRERVMSSIDDLDATIREIRTTIFEITRERSAPAAGLRGRVLSIIGEVTTKLDLPVDVTFEGPLDTVVGPTASDHLIKVLRELLTNIVRHASATHVHVSIELRGGELTVCVADDGIGLRPGRTPGRGLRNLADRAQELQGSFDVSPGESGGTLVLWTARRLD